MCDKNKPIITKESSEVLGLGMRPGNIHDRVYCPYKAFLAAIRCDTCSEVLEWTEETLIWRCHTCGAEFKGLKKVKEGGTLDGPGASIPGMISWEEDDRFKASCDICNWFSIRPTYQEASIWLTEHLKQCHG